MFSKAKPLKFINIKSDGFESKLIHLRILKADREDSPSEGWKEGKWGEKEGGKKGRKKEEMKNGRIQFISEMIFPGVFPLC